MWVIPRNCALSASSLGSEDSTSECNAGHELWLTLSGTPSLRVCSSAVAKARNWTRLLCSRATSPSSQRMRSWVTSTSSRLPRLASHSLLPGLDAGKTTSDTSGLSSLAAFARFDPALSSWRMFQAGDLFPVEPSSVKSSGTWPPSGSVSNGRAYARIKALELRIEESGFSFSEWPTPTAGDAKASGAQNYSTEGGRHPGVTLTDATAGPRGPLTPKGGNDGSTQEAPPRQLNVEFVEFLMGVRVGWTDCEPWEMRSSQDNAKRHLKSSHDGQGS